MFKAMPQLISCNKLARVFTCLRHVPPNDKNE